VRVPRAGARSWPFAVGLVQAGEPRGEGSPAGKSAAGRLAVAVAAYYAGFYLLDVVEVDGRTGVTAGDLARLWSLAVRADAEAVFVLGLDDDAGAVLGPMADELRLVVRVVPADDDDSPAGGPGRGEGAGVGSAAEGVPAVDLAIRMPDVGERARFSDGRGGEWFAPRTTERQQT
jgi:hypothetical protein